MLAQKDLLAVQVKGLTCAIVGTRQTAATRQSVQQKVMRLALCGGCMQLEFNNQ
jgi:hypothetical protein